MVNDYIDKQVGSVGGANQLFIQPKMEMNVGNGTEPSKYNPEKKPVRFNNKVCLLKKILRRLKNLGCYISGTNEIRCYRLYKRSR